MRNGVFGLLLMLMPLGMYAQKTWKVDNQKATVVFTKFDDEVQGTLSGLKAVVKLDMDKPETGSITATVESKTLNTGTSDRDSHLHTDEYFAVAKYPAMKFTSTSMVKTESGYLATGELTIKDVTHPVKMPFFYDEAQKAFVGRIKIHTGHYGIMGEPTPEDDFNTVIRITLPAL
jgi:polyisoprenoid-binding protein YceI